MKMQSESGYQLKLWNFNVKCNPELPADIDFPTA